MTEEFENSLAAFKRFQVHVSRISSTWIQQDGLKVFRC